MTDRIAGEVNGGLVHGTFVHRVDSLCTANGAQRCNNRHRQLGLAQGAANTVLRATVPFTLRTQSAVNEHGAATIETVAAMEAFVVLLVPTSQHHSVQSKDQAVNSLCVWFVLLSKATFNADLLATQSKLFV